MLLFFLMLIYKFAEVFRLRNLGFFRLLAPGIEFVIKLSFDLLRFDIP